MLYTHVTLLMVRVIDVMSKTTIQQSARMLVAEVPGDIQVCDLGVCHNGNAPNYCAGGEVRRSIPTNENPFESIRSKYVFKKLARLTLFTISIPFYTLEVT